MIQTLLVFTLLTLFMFLSVYPLLLNPIQGVTRQGALGVRQRTFWVILSLLVYSLVFGMRYGVGVDYMNYMKYFLDVQEHGVEWGIERMEPLFKQITRFFAYGEFHYSAYFTFLAFAQLGLVYYAFRNERYLYPFFALSFMLLCVWSPFMNGIRQELAFCVFVCSINSLANNKLIRYFLIIAVAFTLHKSALMLFPFYFIFSVRKGYFWNIKSQFILLIIALLLMRLNIIQDTLQRIESIFVIMDYDNYIDAIDQKEHLFLSAKREYYGPIFFIKLGFNSILIAYSVKVKRFFSSSKLNIIYDLFFVGVLWDLVFMSSVMLLRPNYYFYGFQFIIMAYTLTYLFKTIRQVRYSKIVFYTLIWFHLLYFACWMRNMHSNTAQFVFFWQDELKPEKHKQLDDMRSSV